jgi:O-antigen ligase
MYTVGWAALVNLLFSRMFSNTTTGRFGLEVGTVKNPNDFAGHLLLVLPFLLWIALSSKVSVLRFAAIAGLGYGTYLVLASGSRGAFVALIAAVLFYLVRGTARQRIALVAGASIALVVLPAVLPQRALNRLRSVVSASGPLEDTVTSSASRQYLMDLGIKVAFQHPIFGIGQGQFANYEGKTGRVVRGIRGEYQEAHNSYIAAASECGIPAFLFFVAGILSTFRLLNSVFRQARPRPECLDIRTVAFCLMLAMVGFCVSIAFLNFTYFFYLPAMAGISVAVYHAAQEEFRLRSVEPSGARIVETPNWMPASGAGRQIHMNPSREDRHIRP